MMKASMVEYSITNCWMNWNWHMRLLYINPRDSEYPAVVIPLLSGPRMLMNRNLLYTAVTRAKKCVTIVGNDITFNQMIENNSQLKRYSGLRDRLTEDSLQ